MSEPPPTVPATSFILSSYISVLQLEFMYSKLFQRAVKAHNLHLLPSQALWAFILFVDQSSECSPLNQIRGVNIYHNLSSRESH